MAAERGKYGAHVRCKALELCRLAVEADDESLRPIFRRGTARRHPEARGKRIRKFTL